RSGEAAAALRASADLTPRARGAEQSNSSIVFDEAAIMKVFRRVAEGENPDLEVGRLLTERSDFTHTPRLLGSLEYRLGRDNYTVAMLQGYVPNYGDAWEHTLGELDRYFEILAMYRPELTDDLPSRLGLLALSDNVPGEQARDTISGYLESAILLGRRTAELHLALAADSEDPAFAPEPITTMYQRSIYQSMRSQYNRSLELLARKRRDFSPEVRELADAVLSRSEPVHQRLRSVLEGKVSATRIRCHGDFHLGQVLYTGSDFVIIDFEGEPARSLGERRIKRSPLRDVAGMIRSFDYAVSTALGRRAEAREPSEIAELEPWARYWYGWVAATFLRSYQDTAHGAPFVPAERIVFNTLLSAYLLEKALYELEYELNNRPTWAAVPLKGILRLVD
ncbi:MAG TPA: putative maltokinase, partial [Chloroflexota bacterium]|nr:putative maltokinase [Chloroflexota bacterium]